MAAAVQVTQEVPGLASTGETEMTGLSRRSVPPQAPLTLSQAEEGSATAPAGSDREAEEQRRKAEAKERIEGGGAAVVFGFSTLSGCLCIPNDAKRANGVPFGVSLFLAFATFLSGNCLMLLSINMLGLRADLVSRGQHVAARCLVVSCAAFSVLTLLSLVALLQSRMYQYIGLAAVTVVLLPAGGVYVYLLRRPTCVSRDEAAAAAELDEEHKEELDAAWKITSGITNSAFGGLVGVLFSASKTSGTAADAVDRASYVAIFFMFATALLGVFVMTVSKKVPEIATPRFRRAFVTVIRLANALLLCSVACAAFAASFVVLKLRLFAAFAPFVITGIICFFLRNCVDDVPGEANDDRRENLKDRLKAIEDLASKVTTATFGAIMTVLGASIGEKDDGGKQTGARDMFMVVLTSAFVSGFGFMLLAAAPVSAKARMAPAANVLVVSSVALFAATAVAVYAAEVWTL